MNHSTAIFLINDQVRAKWTAAAHAARDVFSTAMNRHIFEVASGG